jgi:hypothetical protein
METKKCSYCGQTILAIAKVCKHCGRRSVAQVEESPVPEQVNHVTTPPPYVGQQGTVAQPDVHYAPPPLPAQSGKTVQFNHTTTPPSYVGQQRTVIQPGAHYAPQPLPAQSGKKVQWWVWTLCGLLAVFVPILGIPALIGLIIYVVVQGNKSSVSKQSEPPREQTFSPPPVPPVILPDNQPVESESIKIEVSALELESVLERELKRNLDLLKVNGYDYIIDVCIENVKGKVFDSFDIFILKIDKGIPSILLQMLVATEGCPKELLQIFEQMNVFATFIRSNDGYPERNFAENHKEAAQVYSQIAQYLYGATEKDMYEISIRQ